MKALKSTIPHQSPLTIHFRLGSIRNKGLVVFHRRGVFHQHFHDFAFDVRFDLVEQFHGFDDTDGLADFYRVADFDKGGFVGPLLR